MNFLKNTLIWLLLPGSVCAQYIQVDASYTTQQLVQNVLIDNPCASASNVVVSGLNFGSGNSFGYFSAGTSSFPFADGIILSTGNAESAVGPNASLLSEGPPSWPGDSDLEQALGINNSVNATIMEFDFVPLADKISFDYIFASEQYLSNPSSNQCNYTDGFAFLLKPANTTQPYQNLAVIPNTNTPVKVNTVRGSGTVCPAANAQYFDAFNDVEHPTNFNGQTVVMTAQATVVPNVTYHIKLVVADQGNNLYDSAIFLGGGSFKIQKDLGPDRLFATGNPVCDGDSVILDATEPGSNTYQWFRNGGTLTGETNPVYTVTTPGIYSVEINLGSGGCLSTGEIEIQYANPVAVSGVSLFQCDQDNDGTAAFNLSSLNSILTQGNNQVTVTYYHNLSDAQGNVDPIQDVQNYVTAAPSTAIAALTNQFGCTGYATVDLQISNNPVTQPAPIGICDEDDQSDGIAWIDFEDMVTPQVVAGLPSGLTVQYYASANDAYTMTNPLPNIFTNTTANQQIVYARILNGPDCYGVIPVTLNISSFPSGFEDEIVFICTNASVTLSVAQTFALYNWSTGDSDYDAVVTTPGIYVVTVTDVNGCSRSKIFDVQLSQTPVILSADVEDFAGGNNTILINYTGNGDYEFSIDGVYFQESPLFTNVAPGDYSLYINDLNNCGNAGPVLVLVMDYPKFFTPNGDGINDFWKIKGLENRAGATLSIFDRYGKLVWFTADGSGWNGKMKAADLPSTDYWFSVALPDGRTIKSHFSLKR
ncbi:MAG TPA: choice-of-anchor L domain-containing protein [Flavobacterium sp.]|jgi:gliding motility-associated-like protein